MATDFKGFFGSGCSGSDLENKPDLDTRFSKTGFRYANLTNSMNPIRSAGI